MKTVLVAGLGLIGGSMAKALKAYSSLKVYGYDEVSACEQMALSSNAIDCVYDESCTEAIDLVIVVMYPVKAIAYMKQLIPTLKKDTIVLDLVGIKQEIVKEIEPIALAHGVSFIGGHPMAGLAKASFERSFADLYQHANMILVPTNATKEGDLEIIEHLMREVGFSHIQYCDEVTHDKMIAHTSQLAHVVSNCYVKADLSENHLGFCGGSYGDMTRIASLNEKVWSELFILNKEPLLGEIETLLTNMLAMKEAIQSENYEVLEELLREGRECKERIDLIRSVT